MEYETEIAASSLLKSRSQVELNSTGSDQVVLALAISGDLVASLSWSRRTRIGRLRNIRHKMTSNERPETLATSSVQQALYTSPLDSIIHPASLTPSKFAIQETLPSSFILCKNFEKCWVGDKLNIYLQNFFSTGTLSQIFKLS